MTVFRKSGIRRIIRKKMWNTGLLQDFCRGFAGVLTGIPFFLRKLQETQKWNSATNKRNTVFLKTKTIAFYYKSGIRYFATEWPKKGTKLAKRQKGRFSPSVILKWKTVSHFIYQYIQRFWKPKKWRFFRKVKNGALLENRLRNGGLC